MSFVVFYDCLKVHARGHGQDSCRALEASMPDDSMPFSLDIAPSKCQIPSKQRSRGWMGHPTRGDCSLELAS